MAPKVGSQDTDNGEKVVNQPEVVSPAASSSSPNPKKKAKLMDEIRELITAAVAAAGNPQVAFTPDQMLLNLSIRPTSRFRVER